MNLKLTLRLGLRSGTHVAEEEIEAAPVTEVEVGTETKIEEEPVADVRLTCGSASGPAFATTSASALGSS